MHTLCVYTNMRVTPKTSNGLQDMSCGTSSRYRLATSLPLSARVYPFHCECTPLATTHPPHIPSSRARDLHSCSTAPQSTRSRSRPPPQEPETSGTPQTSACTCTQPAQHKCPRRPFVKKSKIKFRPQLSNGEEEQGWSIG
jgi:hypothetical protein